MKRITNYISILKKNQVDNDSLKKRLEEMEQRLTALQKPMPTIVEEQTENSVIEKRYRKKSEGQSKSIENELKIIENEPKNAPVSSISAVTEKPKEPPAPPKIRASILPQGMSLDALRLL